MGEKGIVILAGLLLVAIGANHAMAEESKNKFHVGVRSQIDAAANRHHIAPDRTIHADSAADGDHISVDDFIGANLYSAADSDAIGAATGRRR